MKTETTQLACDNGDRKIFIFQIRDAYEEIVPREFSRRLNSEQQNLVDKVHANRKWRNQFPSAYKNIFNSLAHFYRYFVSRLDNYVLICESVR